MAKTSKRCSLNFLLKLTSYRRSVWRRWLFDSWTKACSASAQICTVGACCVRRLRSRCIFEVACGRRLINFTTNDLRRMLLFTAIIYCSFKLTKAFEDFSTTILKGQDGKTCMTPKSTKKVVFSLGAVIGLSSTNPLAFSTSTSLPDKFLRVLLRADLTTC